jgi:ADP-heptose:LPS heptosyltransferase
VSVSRREARLALLRLAARPTAGLGRLRRRRSPWGRPPRILLMRPDHLGDLLLAGPAAAVLREALPGAQVDWLVGPWSAEMARRAGHLDRAGVVRTLDFPGFTRRPKRSAVEPYAALWQAAAQLRAEQYDAALILRQDHWWGAMLASLAGIPRRFGYAVPECLPFLTDTLPIPSGAHRHAVRTNQALARLAGSRLSGQPPVRSLLDPSFTTSPDEQVWARAWLSDHLPSGPTQIIAIHPGAGAPIKQWLPEGWAEVARAMRDRFDARIFLTGGPGEHDLVEQVAARLDPRPPSIVGASTIGQLAALFEACDLVFGCDSGPLHLATAVSTMTVRLYGPTDDQEFGPWSRDRHRWPIGHRSVGHGTACPLWIQPCGYLADPPCGFAEHPPCMREIAPAAVASAAIELLEFDGGYDERGFDRNKIVWTLTSGGPAC